MTFSWYCNPDALPALVVRQRASVSTGFSGILTFGTLEVPHLLVFNTVVVNSGLGHHEEAVLLDGAFLELRYGHPAGRQVVAAHVGLDQTGVHVHLGRQHPQPQ